jgi:hypothetical protein
MNITYDVLLTQMIRANQVSHVSGEVRNNSSAHSQNQSGQPFLLLEVKNKARVTLTQVTRM